MAEARLRAIALDEARRGNGSGPAFRALCRVSVKKMTTPATTQASADRNLAVAQGIHDSSVLVTTTNEDVAAHAKSARVWVENTWDARAGTRDPTK